MGNCLSYNDDPEASGSPDQVQIELKAQTKKEHSQVKVLLLGPSDSGKSTILKQMRIIHNDKFTPQEIESYRQLVFNNIVRGAVMLSDALPAMGMQLLPENERFVETLRNVSDLQDGEVYPEELLQPLQDLWGDLGAQKGWSRANEAALPENLEYFFGDLPRVFQPGYLPTTQDIIWCRAPTTGTAERMFKLRGKELNLVEVGGQRFARRQWVHCFHDVPAIMFVVSLSGYDQCMFENPGVNRMKDAMDTWNVICDSKYFRSTNIILLFNKDDLFSEKVKKSPIKRYFSDYEGPEGDAVAGRKYFLRQFLKLSKLSSKTPQDDVPSERDSPPPHKREIYTHFTNATSDTALSRVVMTAVEGYSFHAKLFENIL
ncbi:guanine nucleotide-binding protein alpha-2 subunit [Rhizoctonia solani]|nr:guanine nucleotide-binding protein alpha-2 subunit [Rhizoctonia solani]